MYSYHVEPKGSGSFAVGLMRPKAPLKAMHCVGPILFPNPVRSGDNANTNHLCMRNVELPKLKRKS
jgi:hypothetical protein